ncbi:MAG: DUF5071 domain-containing protein [Clostridia bacterium]|nr:DUF5071 domain-containing protein [Clostridia bacterium]
MSMTTDEIYTSFLWDESYTEEEYEAKIAAGIQEIRNCKYIYPFILPCVTPENSKSIWEPCATGIALRSNEELEPYLLLLFEWLQDINWPGAITIFNRLLQMPFSMLESDYTYTRHRAEQENDTLWLATLDNFDKQLKK